MKPPKRYEKIKKVCIYTYMGLPEIFKVDQRSKSVSLVMRSDFSASGVTLEKVLHLKRCDHL